MVSTRNLPGARRPEFTFGSTDCHYGYEGNVDEMRYAVLQIVLLLLLYCCCYCGVVSLCGYTAALPVL
jgi:hypothetical protein